MKREVVKRRYDATLRTEQAARTRHRVLVAARELFVSEGYASTSMAAVATAAGVSRETVYKVFGTKQALLKTVWDVTLVGDEVELAVAEREAFQAMLADPDPRSALHAFAVMSAELVERLGPLMAVVLGGARAGDPDLRELAATSEAERRAGVHTIVTALSGKGGLRPGVSTEHAVDIVWVLVSPEVSQLLVDSCGWSIADYRDWLERTLIDAVLPAS
jgi:AcrR family transcriptional regulator